jgi:hypothetical protein
MGTLAYDFGDWVTHFCDLHDRFRKGQLEPDEAEAYRRSRNHMAEMLVLAQRINIKGEGTRKAVRVARALPIEYELPGGRISCLTLDISVGGLSSLVAEAPPLGTVVDFRLKMGREVDPIVGRCKVVAAAPQQGSTRMAVMFDALSPEDADRIQTIVFDVVCSQLRLAKLA